MKLIYRLIVSVLLLSISFYATSQDSLYATRSVYRCGIHYIIVFKYKPIPDSIKTRIIKLRYQIDSHKDSIVNDTVVLYIFKSLASLYEEVPKGTDLLTDPTPVTLQLDKRGILSDFLTRVFDKLCNQPKKQSDNSSVQPSLQANVPGHTSHWKPAVKRGDGSFWMIGNENKGNAGDTIVLSGNYTYGYISQDYNSDVVLYTDGKQASFKSGITIENTNHLRIDGSGGDSLYGINITGGGTNMTVTGKSNYIDIGYVDMRNGGVGGIFDKTEVSDVQNKYGCDPSYLYPTRAMYHHLHHLRLKNIQGDGLYEGSTGSTGGRPLNCSGTVTYPKPMGVGFVELDHIVMDSINRQGGQVSGADTGFVLVHDNIIFNTGYEYNPVQGAGWSIGSLTKDAKVYRNIFSHNFLYNFYSYGDGATEFYDNVLDTAAQVGIRGTQGWKGNPEQIPSTLFAPQQSKSSLVIKDNITGYNTAQNDGKPVGFVIYGNDQIFSVGGNIFCNNKGNLHNAAEVDFQTTCSDITYTITASSDSKTVITPDGVTAVPSGGNQQYTIVADKGYSVADVKVDGVSIGAATGYIFTNVKANHTISATSGTINYTIIASSIGGGVVSPPGSTSVSKGNSITYTITPSAGWHTKTLLVDDKEQHHDLTTYTFKNVKANHTISATFAENLYTITSSASAGGVIKPEGKMSVNPGDSKSYIFIPEEGYQVSNIVVDGVDLGALKEYTFFDVMEDHTIRAGFKKASGPNLPPTSVPAFDALLSDSIIITSLSGILSSDPDGTIDVYKWQQIGGEPVTISHEAARTTQVTGFGTGTYKFELTVTDNSGSSSAAIIAVVVTEPNDNVSKKYAIRSQSSSVK